MKSSECVVLILVSLAIACSDAAQDEPLAPHGPSLAASTTGEISSTSGFRKAITAANIRTHQAALQAIADNNAGDRASWKPSHTASANYVRQLMVAAGYQVTTQTFPVDVKADNSEPIFNIITPSPQTLVRAVDFQTMEYSGSGDATGNVVPIDVTLVGSSNSGCEAADFAGFPAGSIALIERGTCTFAQKVLNAEAAGATAVIMFNDGVGDVRDGFILGTLQAPQKSIPTVSTSYAIGRALALTPSTARVKVDYLVTTSTSTNVIAESPLGSPNDLVVVGASLDSDVGSPGINSASGAAAQLEIARAFAQDRGARNRVRFVWFGGFWEGRVGSTAYVASLSSEEKGRLRAMLNIGPIGSPNFVRFVFDGDNSVFPPSASTLTGPAGSGEIERILNDYFDGSQLAKAPVGLPIGFDLAAFAQAGIPVGGIYTGQTGAKTAQEQSIFGGVAGVDYDPCTRAPCDTFANISVSALDVMSDAAAHTTLLLSKKNFLRTP